MSLFSWGQEMLIAILVYTIFMLWRFFEGEVGWGGRGGMISSSLPVSSGTIWQNSGAITELLSSSSCIVVTLTLPPPRPSACRFGVWAVYVFIGSDIFPEYLQVRHVLYREYFLQWHERGRQQRLQRVSEVLQLSTVDTDLILFIILLFICILSSFFLGNL